MTNKKSKNKKRKQKSKPVDRRYTIYSLPSKYNTIVGIVFLVFLAFGIGVFFEGEYIAAMMPFLMATTLAYAALTEVQTIDIFQDLMIVDTALSRNIYKANEIINIEWRMATFLKRGGYGFKLMLYIDTTHGKSIRLQPPIKYDIEKSILDWRDKYQERSETINQTEI